MSRPVALAFPLLVLALAGCLGSLRYAGSGQLSDGSPVAGLAANNLDTGVKTITITSPAGWECKAEYQKANGDGLYQGTVPLKCSDGATGTLILSNNRVQQQMVGSFKLSNGKTGQVVFGLT